MFTESQSLSIVRSNLDLIFNSLPSSSHSKYVYSDDYVERKQREFDSAVARYRSNSRTLLYIFLALLIALVVSL